MPLFRDAREQVRLERWTPNTEVMLEADGGIELLVLDGDFTDSGERLEPESWLRLPPGSRLQARVGGLGCKVWIKRGHLSSRQS
jgi:hypothetical protein